MHLVGLAKALLADTAVAGAVEASTLPGGPQIELSGVAGVWPALTALLSQHRTLLAVTATGRAAEDLAADLREYLPRDVVVEFPAWETLPHERLSPRSDTVGQRLAALRRLAHPTEHASLGPIRVLVAPVRAVLQPLVAGLADLEPVSLAAGQDADLSEVVDKLARAAYSHTDMVERRGEFAVRGGILDIFPATGADHPLRVEFWGDTVEEIRSFSVADQRSLEIADDGVWASPCREILLTDAVRRRAADLKDALPGAAEMLDKIANGIAVEGMESLAPALADGMQPLTDLVGESAAVLVVDPERVRARSHDLVATSEEFLAAAWSNATAGNVAPVDLSQASFYTLEQVRALAADRGLPWWSLSPFTTDAELVPESDVLHVEARPVRTYGGDVAAALVDLRAQIGQGLACVVTTQGLGPAQRMVEMLKQAEVPARLIESLAERAEPGVVHVTTASAHAGFVAENLNLALVTEADLLGKAGVTASTRDMRRMPSRRRNQVDPLQLRPGDHVVHEQHGVGRFVEMVQRTVQKAEREYLVVEYAPNKKGQPADRLYVPTDTLHLVTKYVGGEVPSLNRMGGGDWAKTKSRARKHVRQIAGELIRLYSARMATSGYAFGPDTPWQRELEDAFAYVETPDQVATIQEVKDDMEKPIPMDRLICGDVGYGKTEIAVRAAFKSVQDGKQVAVLVPTTLLVQQHLDTFSERFAPFPVKVRALSRFQTDAEAADAKAGVADGSIDLLIGTHRLLTGEVRFKDLGLVVVDEEQRFGVEHKETLKQLRTNVDVLAMSATPIPRTLEMAITGIREMSTLATPPEERHPVLTFVGGYDDKQVSAAIRRELLREGQVFFIHNRVQDIEKTATHLRDLIPEARIATGHGRMSEKSLEQVIVDFWEKRFDVLVCTTIVETGLDISNANTLIVDRADRLGLSQLHQLRGRVGRGRERAYAYFFYPSESPLTDTAQDRLATIAQHTDLGAGMAVAMKDLEIRGAGNLLGGEQSGHIEGVGFDLYVRMVGEAVAELRDGGAPPRTEVKIELPVDAHLPHDYISHERLRLEAYRKLAGVESDQGVADLVAELTDRYGEPPEPVRNLFAVARFAALARRAGLSEITVQGTHVRLAPVELPESATLRLKRVYPGSLIKPALRTILVPAPREARIGGRPLRDGEVLAWAARLVRTVLLDEAEAT